MRKKIAGVSLVAGLIAVAVTVGAVAMGSAEGRQLEGQFCTNPNALPKPAACIQLAFGDDMAQGYTGSTDREIALRPGTYWLTVNDTSAMHNFSIESPDGVDQDITGVGETGSVTVKVHLTHGRYTLFCAPHRAMGMFVNLEVGGEGQVG